jgi:hypothetical protein
MVVPSGTAFLPGGVKPSNRQTETLEREERFSDETAARNGSGTLALPLGHHARVEMGQPDQLETYPLGLRHIAYARIEDWAHAVSFENGTSSCKDTGFHRSELKAGMLVEDIAHAVETLFVAQALAEQGAYFMNRDFWEKPGENFEKSCG